MSLIIKHGMAGLRYVGLQLTGVVIALVIAALFGRHLVEAVVYLLASPWSGSTGLATGSGIWPRLLGQLVYDLSLLLPAAAYAELLRGRLLPPRWWQAGGGQLVMAVAVDLTIGYLVLGQIGITPARLAGRLAALLLVIVIAWLVARRRPLNRA